jgi:hypothetical protein
MGERAGAMSEREVSELREDIADTRMDISRTIDQIEEKLDPKTLEAQVTEMVRQATDQMVREFQEKTEGLSEKFSAQIESALQGVATTKIDQFLNQAGSTASHAGEALWGFVGKNPLPLAFAAVGIGLLASEGEQLRRHMHDGNGSASLDGMLSSLKETLADQESGIKNAASSLQEKASGLVHSVGQTAKESTGEGDSGSALGAMIGDSPLMPGLLALGLGIVAGLAIPRTGEETAVSESLREQMKSGLDQLGISDSSGQGQGLIDRVKENAGATLAQAKESVKTSASSLGDAVSTMGAHMADAAKESASGQH